MLQFHQTIDSFHVEEELLYPLSGEGEYQFVKIRKRGIPTQKAMRRLSESTGVPLRSMNYAGMKDTFATATQWLAWPHKEQRAEPVEVEGLDILASERHETRLGIGHVKANHFCLHLVGEGPLPSESVLTQPFPNFYGGQRFGKEPRPLPWLLKNTPKAKDKVSVLQSALFNAYLRQRIEAGPLGFDEDELWTATNGKRIFSAPRDEELEARINAGEVAATGPMFGYKRGLRPHEAAFIEELGINSEFFRKFGKVALGARRVLWVKPANVKTEQTDDGWKLRFSLPSGAYATVYLTNLFMPEVFKGTQWPNFSEPVVLCS